MYLRVFFCKTLDKISRIFFYILLKCISVQANPGWSSQSSDSEDDHMKQRNVSSDEEDLQKAVQDLGLVVLGNQHFPRFLEVFLKNL